MDSAGHVAHVLAYAVRYARARFASLANVRIPMSRRSPFTLFYKGSSMNRLFTLSAAAAALTLTPAVLAHDEGVHPHGAEDQVEAAVGEATPVRLVSWDGDFELLKTSRRLRIWRSHVAYRLTVDAQGNATECELTEQFRMRRINETLCDVLLEHHTFEPAMDASGMAIEGSYEAQISYREMIERS